MPLQNTHTGKAQSYDLGRPAYPAAFYDWLYGKLELDRGAVIADIGAGTGTVTKDFLERGSRVVAVEPDDDMRRILAEKLSAFEHCTVLGNSAEDTGIPSDSIDLIFCGNAYHWFDRAKAIPEFRRILKDNNSTNVVIATLFKPQDMPAPFHTMTSREFDFIVDQSWSVHLSGHLSASFNPNPGDDNYDDFVQTLRRYFDQHSRDGLLKTEFRLSCTAGHVNDLI